MVHLISPALSDTNCAENVVLELGDISLDNILDIINMDHYEGTHSIQIGVRIVYRGWNVSLAAVCVLRWWRRLGSWWWGGLALTLTMEQ